jgi:uncharacterized protein with ParB-like and HNH nuclease domain/predicted transport protein
VKASEKPLLKFLQGTNQFRIPIYQRTYSWTRDQCLQFWQDIVRASEDPNSGGHFVGSIVYVEADQYHVGTVPELLVIDGQQRLTTLTLLLTALAKRLPTSGSEMTVSKLANYYLLNQEEEGSLRYKLVLTRSDAATLKAIVDDAAPPVQVSQRVQRNYEHFTEWLGGADVDPLKVFAGIQRLMVVDIALDRHYDNPQLIFESLNSTGLALTQADLIRNFVLMGLEADHQDALYTNRWFPMEEEFGDQGTTGHFDRFVRDYLTLKTGRIPNIDQIYAAFKDYARGRSGSMDDIVADLQRFAGFHAAFALEREAEKALRSAYRDLNTLRVDVAYPFLLHLADLRDRGSLDLRDHVRAVRLVEAYVLRRLICGIPTNTLGKTFAGLPELVPASGPLEALEATMLLKDSYRRLPDDEEFTREFVTKDIYNLRNRNYILRKLENSDRKEELTVEDYTIEHVLPQNANLSAAWRTEIGPDWKEVQARYLHTIGNLTLTGYNSELSDRPFAAKQTMDGGFKDSPIRLNKDLGQREHWREEDIQDRATKLAKLACHVWPAPKLPQDVLELYRPKPKDGAYTIADHPHLVGDSLALFEELRKRVLNIDSSVTEEFQKLYIAFKSPSNFLDVIPQKDKLKLSVDIGIDDLDDPRGLARDVSDVGHWGNGETEFTLTSATDLDYALSLITQAYEAQATDADS